MTLIRGGSSAVREGRTRERNESHFSFSGRFFLSLFSHAAVFLFLLLSSSPSSPLLPGNCGETDNLLRCSRCRTAWYCCRACQKVRGENRFDLTRRFFFVFFFPFSSRQGKKRRLSLSPFSLSSITLSLSLKSHWPFHREDCRSNAFADAIEDSEPKFASWLRRHGTQVREEDGEKEQEKKTRKEEEESFFFTTTRETKKKKREKKNSLSLRPPSATATSSGSSTPPRPPAPRSPAGS